VGGSAGRVRVNRHGRCRTLVVRLRGHFVSWAGGMSWRRTGRRRIVSTGVSSVGSSAGELGVRGVWRRGVEVSVVVITSGWRGRIVSRRSDGPRLRIPLWMLIFGCEPCGSYERLLSDATTFTGADEPEPCIRSSRSTWRKQTYINIVINIINPIITKVTNTHLPQLFQRLE
jgi:hypothetical protein